MPPQNGRSKLDLNDMERRTVDFRVILDREKRRFQLAQMIDLYEKLLRDRLLEIRKDQAGRRGGGGTQQPDQPNDNPQDQQQGASQQQQQQQQPDDSTTNPDNEIKLTCMDKEGSARLRNFLAYTIEMCKRVDQQELIQDVLRGALMDTRRKRFKTQQDNPNVSPEPFCLFCAADLNAVTLASECQEHCRQHTQTRAAPAAITSVALPRVDLIQDTPPPSTVPTPEVGEQSHIYTPNAGTRDSSSGSPPAGQNQKETNVKSRIIDRKIKTNASSSSETGQVVLPSDEDESSSGEQNPSSLRNIMDWANRSKSPYKKVAVASTGSSGTDSDGVTDGRRCSTPLGDNLERSLPHLVIDETDQRTCSSPIPRVSKSLKGGKSIGTSFTSPAEVKPNLRQQQPQQQQQPQEHGPEMSSRVSMDTSVSRLDGSGQQQQPARGGCAIKKKFKPRRRNKNN